VRFATSRLAPLGVFVLGVVALAASAGPAAAVATAPVPASDSLAAVVVNPPGPDRDEPGPPSERRVKAAFLYKFSGYVEWPATAGVDADSTIVFGVMGDDELADELSLLVEHRGPGARPVRVLKVHAFEPRPRLHVLFIGHGESDRLGPLIRSAREKPVLVVTDTEGALGLGSMINFVTTGGHVRFEVGLGAARRGGLTLSARLLAVAQAITQRTP